MALTEHMLSDNNSHFNLQSHSIKLLLDHAHAYQSMHCEIHQFQVTGEF